MEFFKDFIFDEAKHTVNIVWNNNETLFNASDIGHILNIRNMHQATYVFTKEQKRFIFREGYNGEQQDTLFLTERGVCRITCSSGTCKAWELQEWMRDEVDRLDYFDGILHRLEKGWTLKVHNKTYPITNVQKS